jgi:hypothetical protein
VLHSGGVFAEAGIQSSGERRSICINKLDEYIMAGNNGFKKKEKRVEMGAEQG